MARRSIRGKTGEGRRLPFAPATEIVEPSAHEAAFYGSDVAVATPSDDAELVEIVRHADENGLPVVPAGLGSRAYLGNPPPPDAVVVSLRQMKQLLHHEPGDFTVTVQAGMPLQELRDVLRASGQELPIDTLRSAPGSTGGLVSTAEPGPRAGFHGPLRSLLLGARAVRGDGGIYRTGGRVVKNVAGYDLQKLLLGALGTAGILLELSFRLKALPARRAAGVASFGSGDSAWQLLAALRAAGLEPAFLGTLAGDPAGLPADGAVEKALEAPPRSRLVLWLFEGNAERVRFQEESVERILTSHPCEACAGLRSREESDALVDYLCSLPYPGNRAHPDLGIVRLLTLPGTTRKVEGDVLTAFEAHKDIEARVTSDALTGAMTIRWKTGTVGAGAPSPTPVEQPVSLLRKVAADNAARGVIVYLPPEVRRSHEYLLRPDPQQELADRLLRVLDPRGVLSPGRVHAKRWAEAGSEEA